MEEGPIGFLCIIAVFVAFFGGCEHGSRNAYKQGQIDAFNGVIKYQLATNDDGESVWELIPVTEAE